MGKGRWWGGWKDGGWEVKEWRLTPYEYKLLAFVWEWRRKGGVGGCVNGDKDGGG